MSTKPRPVVVANWKSNGTRRTLEEVLDAWSLFQPTHSVDCYIAPSYIHLPFVQEALKSSSTFQIAAQNCVTGPGVYTGEVHMQQLLEYGVNTFVLGHSERRKKFTEDNFFIAEKVEAVLNAEGTAIVCVGEKYEERLQEQTKKILFEQLRPIMAKVSCKHWERVIVAYEPVWAIGTGKVASPKKAQEVHGIIRDIVAEYMNETMAKRTRIVYGGGVTKANAFQLYDQPDVNGFLVGSASLRPDFVEIIQCTASGDGVT